MGKSLGIFPIVLSNYSELHDRLFDIAHMAASLRATSLIGVAADIKTAWSRKLKSVKETSLAA